MFDDNTQISLLLVVVAACAALMRPAVFDILGYALVAATLGAVARAAAVGASTLPGALRAALRERRS